MILVHIYIYKYIYVKFVYAFLSKYNDEATFPLPTSMKWMTVCVTRQQRVNQENPRDKYLPNPSAHSQFLSAVEQGWI